MNICLFSSPGTLCIYAEFEEVLGVEDQKETLSKALKVQSEYLQWVGVFKFITKL